MEKYIWSSLNALQIGKYAEYYAKMEFTLYGFDVFTSEVDDKGIDFFLNPGFFTGKWVGMLQIIQIWQSCQRNNK